MKKIVELLNSLTTGSNVFYEASAFVLEYEGGRNIIINQEFIDKEGIEEAERIMKLYFNNYIMDWNCRHNIYFDYHKSSIHTGYFWKPCIRGVYNYS